MFKNKLFIFASLIACLALTTGCKEDEEINPMPPPTNEGMLYDGGEISGIGFYCLVNNQTSGSSHWLDYYQRTKTVPNYSSFRMILMFDRNGSFSISDRNLIEQMIIENIEHNYTQEKSLFILDSYKKYSQQVATHWPILFTAYTNGEVTITCDKTLFGEEPGTNLSSYFTVMSTGYPCVPIGIENPGFLYNFGEKQPTKASELFADGTWLQPEYRLVFTEQPSERYEELTLSVSWPMIREHVRDYAVARYKGEKPEPIFTESTFEAKCLIKFDWK